MEGEDVINQDDAQPCEDGDQVGEKIMFGVINAR
jgi:hypothetical protein